MARVWELSANKGNDLLMLLAIADFADDEGNAYPAVPTLAAKCRMKPRNANLILAALRASGELEVRQNEGPHGTNRYRVVLPGSPLQVSTGLQKSTGMQKPTRTPVETHPKPLQVSTDEPSVNHQEPSTHTIDAKKPHLSCSPSTGVSAPDGFSEFWEAYGKKVGRANAIKQWKKLNPDAALVRLMITAAGRYSASTEQQFRKDPERWISGRRWEDETEHTSRAVTAGNESIFAGAL